MRLLQRISVALLGLSVIGMFGLLMYEACGWWGVVAEIVFAVLFFFATWTPTTEHSL